MYERHLELKITNKKGQNMNALKAIGYVFLLILLWAMVLFALLVLVADTEKLTIITVIYFAFGIIAIIFAVKRFIKNGYRINKQGIHLSKHGESVAKLAEAKFLASKINNSRVDTAAFCRGYNALCECMDRLIWLNEKRRVPMEPKPRANKERIINNLPATVNDFIDRSVREILSSSGYASAINWLNDLPRNNEFAPFISHGVSEHINQILNSNFECLERTSAIDLSDIDNMEGHAFEYWCADLLAKNGFINVSVTQGSGDQGVDILAEKDNVRYAIQCKCYHSDLGNTPVQEVFAGKEFYNCQVGAVMTNRHFTAGARQLADKTLVMLWDREKIIEMLNSAGDKANA